jgi:hypothetical protein
MEAPSPCKEGRRAEHTIKPTTDRAVTDLCSQEVGRQELQYTEQSTAAEGTDESLSQLQSKLGDTVKHFILC